MGGSADGGQTGGGQAGRRALLTFTLYPPTDNFQLTPPSLLSPPTGYRPPDFHLVPPLRLDGGSAAPTVTGAGAGATAAPAASGSSAVTQAAPAAPSRWQLLSQAVVQLNPANLSFIRGVAAPVPAATLQFNILFAGLDNRLQLGEYISGTLSLSPDDTGSRAFGLSYGFLIGGNDLWVPGPLSFINPNLQVSPFNPQLQVGPSFGNLGQPNANAVLAANISNFINFSMKNSAVTVGVGGQIGYAYDLGSGISAFNASLLLQFQLQRALGAP